VIVVLHKKIKVVRVIIPEYRVIRKRHGQGTRRVVHVLG